MYLGKWLFYFYIYSFLGWCFESAEVSIRTKRPVNRGFMRGPFLPLYGSGATMMLVVSMPFADNLLLTYVAGCIGATVLEYVTAVIMEALFNVRYWDYSYRRLNFQGRICLVSTLLWGFFTVMMTRVFHAPIAAFTDSIPPMVRHYVTMFLTAYVVVDFALAFKTAMDLRDILLRMQSAKEELMRMQKRLDVLIAFHTEDKEQKRQERELLMDELTTGLEQRFRRLRDALPSIPGNYVDSLKEELSELRIRYNIYMERRRAEKEELDFLERDMLRNNPNMSSGRFRDTLEELKNAVISRIN